jgi:ABC-2 type transport system permease protein
MSLGMLVGVSNKNNEEAKMGILVSVTMTCSFLAGMMFLQMKYIVAENVPLLAKINPVSMITDGLYALYYYDTLDRYIFNVISLIIFSIIMITLSYIFIRRKKYDSI